MKHLLLPGPSVLFLFGKGLRLGGSGSEVEAYFVILFCLEVFFFERENV